MSAPRLVALSKESLVDEPPMVSPLSGDAGLDYNGLAPSWKRPRRPTPCSTFLLTPNLDFCVTTDIQIHDEACKLQQIILHISPPFAVRKAQNTSRAIRVKSPANQILF